MGRGGCAWTCVHGCVCTHPCTHTHRHEEERLILGVISQKPTHVWHQRTICGSEFSPLCGTWGSNSGHQTWHKGLYPQSHVAYPLYSLKSKRPHTLYFFSPIFLHPFDLLMSRDVLHTNFHSFCLMTWKPASIFTWVLSSPSLGGKYNKKANFIRFIACKNTNLCWWAAFDFCKAKKKKDWHFTSSQEME